MTLGDRVLSRIPKLLSLGRLVRLIKARGRAAAASWFTSLQRYLNRRRRRRLSVEDAVQKVVQAMDHQALVKTRRKKDKKHKR